MPVPDYQALMLPLLRLASDGREHSVREAVDRLADEHDLTPEDRAKVLPSGRQPILSNRVGWATTYLSKAGLLERTKRGIFRLTEAGREVLARNPPSISVRFLEQFRPFSIFATALARCWRRELVRQRFRRTWRLPRKLSRGPT